MSRVVALVIAFAMLAGCASFERRNTLVPLAIDMPRGSPDVAFQHMVAVTRSVGYPIDFADVRYGVFGTHTRTSLSGREGAATVVVQCYADGRATVTLLGGSVVDETRTRVPDVMRREVVRFAQTLESGGPLE